jgi:outer membrane protein assembly factor BamB
MALKPTIAAINCPNVREPNEMKKLATLLALFAAPACAQSVTTYHNGIARHGDYILPGLTTTAAAKMHLDTAFNAPVTGNIYAQPLFWQVAKGSGEVIVATESNIVYALNPDTGAIIWQTTLGAPVPSSDLPCGNINPEGITGTPALDPANGDIYVDALIDTANGPRHQIFALLALSGLVKHGYPIDVQTAATGDNFDSYTQGERSGLLFLNGALYVSYAGRSGDCRTYHGTIIQIDTASQTLAGFWATRANGGGIWAQGGPFSNGAAIYVTTGNTMNASTWSDGEAIIRLAPGLAHSTDPKDYFTPSNWQTLDNEDADLGGTDAVTLTVPVPGGGTAERLLALGKDGNAYLVTAENLGGIGHQIATVSVSSASIITATAVYSTPAVTLVAFHNYNDPKCGGSATTMLHITPLDVIKQWCTPLSGGGAPIVTTTDGVHNPIVWVIGASGDQLLHGYDALSGATVFNGGGSANTIAGTRNFATIIASNGKFYVAGQGRIYAFTYFTQ